MKSLRTLIVALSVAAFLPLAAQSAETAAEAEDEAEAAPKCLKASVNPVTGHAICLEPKGAPVDPPPPAAFNRPCKPRAHDDDPWTIYEHGSGC